MSRFLILSNGNLLVGYDSRCQVRDFYFPYVGLENQSGGPHKHRLGIWTDNRFSWLDDPAWQVTTVYHPQTLASSLSAVNSDLQVELQFTDVVYNEKDIFVRQVVVENQKDQPRLIKIFFHQQFEIYESFRKDTAFFDPTAHVLIHYKGRRVFLVNAVSEGQSFDDYSTGLFNIENREGTYKDAEDGVLAKNPIEHGPVDSILSLSLNLNPASKQSVYYWIAASKIMPEVYQLNDYVLQKTPAHLIKSTRDYWHAWINRQNFDFQDLSAPVVNLFQKSLFLIRSHADNRGGIIASCDSDMLQYGRDTYSYVWPRDGSFTATALDQVGDHEVAKRFFEFCAEIISPAGYFLHKYRPDKALGSSWHPWVRDDHPQLPIQEDETALVVFALWRHYQLDHDLEFIESVYHTLIEKPAEFMADYRYPEIGLPRGSYDLWEEKYGTSTFTSAAVYAALNSAAKFADLLGKTDSSHNYRLAAQAIREGIMKHLYNWETSSFHRFVNFEASTPYIDSTPDISAVYGVFKFGVLSSRDDQLAKAVAAARQNLYLNTSVGGVARYAGDHYHRPEGGVPGNPWIITTLWLAQYYLSQAQKPGDLDAVRQILAWVVDHALPSGILSEQLDAYTGEQLSAAPLTWSHSEFVITVLEYLDILSRFKS